MGACDGGAIGVDVSVALSVAHSSHTDATCRSSLVISRREDDEHEGNAV